VVNDRPASPLRLDLPAPLRQQLHLLDGPGRGPAAARNVGWRAAKSTWVVFLDDDVHPGQTWRSEVREDLASAGDAAAVAGRIRVPLPDRRRPTDWERQVAALATAPWITADLAYRRDVLVQVGGFDERFPRAYREDTDLAVRVGRLGHTLIHGQRRSTHPVGPAGPWVSVLRQVGNADDALLRRLYGRHWRRLAGIAPGRRRQHVLATASGLLAVGALLARRPAVAFLAGLMWTGLTAEFAARRIAPGPRSPAEVGIMLATSAAIPPVATMHWLRGWSRHRGATPMVGALADSAGEAGGDR
jgi:hypothetical protein